MKVLFSNPPWWVGPRGRHYFAGVRAGSRWPHTVPVASRPDHFEFGGYLPYPFFMGYAATYLSRESGVAVRFRDSIALRESLESYFRYLTEERFDYVFIESSTPSWEADANLIRQIHVACPETRIVVTGPVAVAKASAILEELPVHACIKGEYEKGSVRVLEGESGIIDFDLLTRSEMNAAPFPHFDDSIAYRYWDANPCGQLAPHAQVWSSRGCPYKCIFCVWPATMTGNDPDGNGKRSVRHYDADYMEAFLRELVERFDYRCIYFDDDTFNLGDRHVLAMCGVMARIGLPWSAMCRADTIETETWSAMADSGCFGVKIGFESGNQQVVDEIVNKRLDLARARDVVHECKRVGLSVHGTFTYGLPGETREQMQDTRRFIASLPFDTYQESGTAAIEGTPLDTLLKKGDLERYRGARVEESFDDDPDGSAKMSSLRATL